MFKLLNSEDKNVLGSSNFAKNACFYKDMLSFCDGFSAILENIENLPKFCFDYNGKLSLEGICLLMKMYATEFKFETIKLSLDYLKILYYTAATFAEENVVDESKIIEEFDNYRNASVEYCEKQKDEVNEKLSKLNESRKLAIKKDAQSISKKKSSKIFNVLAIIMLILSILGVSAPVLVINFLQVSSPYFIVSIVLVLVGFILTISFKIASKKFDNMSADLAFGAQNLRKSNLSFSEEFNGVEAKYNRVVCEKYEYEMCLPELLSKYSKVLTINEILEKSKEYRLLSYNLSYDISRLFKSQQREVENIISDIESIVVSGDYKNDFENIYSRIYNQDWLYYNSEVRLYFLKKFADIGEKEFDWKLDYNGQKINPFDIDVKKLTREMVAYSSEKDEKFISAPLSDFIRTKYFKNLDDLSFKGSFSIDELKRVKSNYLNHFYNYELFAGNNSLFYDKKSKGKINYEALTIDKCSYIPTLVNLKLRLIESGSGLGNSDAKIINNIANSIFVDEKENEKESLVLSDSDIEYPKFTSSSTDEFDDCIIYNVNGRKVVGYRIDDDK